MVKAACSDEEFIELVEKHGCAQASRILNISERSVHGRRNNLERILGITIKPPTSNRVTIKIPKRGSRFNLKVKDGCVLVFSDAHFWPGDRSPAFDALIKLTKKFKPRAIICNGDAFDGARISRHPQTEFSHAPMVVEELQAVQESLGAIEAAAPKECPLIWCVGNHDIRLTARLAQVAPEYVGMHGTDIKDHFPAWQFCWSTCINGHTMVKHRWKGGIHATHNNTVQSGMNMVTGHLHSQKVTPFTDYNGTRYGVDTGTLSEIGPEHDKFTWLEDAPVNWRQGFAVLKFRKDGSLLPPQLVSVLDDNTVWFCNEPV